MQIIEVESVGGVMTEKIYLLSMNNERAREFFLKPVSYFSQNLPRYFNLSFLLDSAAEKLGKNQLKDKNHLLYKANYSGFSNINYTIQVNKKSNTYRPITLIHPYLYMDYVNLLTKEDNWEKLKARFEYLQEKVNGRIICSSLPFDVEENNKKEYALNFWQSIEQETIKYSLSYTHLLKLDISNFYGSIYTHTLCWALHGENESKVAKNKGELNKLLGDLCDKKFQHMNYGETVGIPQGNVISDLMSELLLAYIDYKLVEKIEKNEEHIDFKILRYRDDYRIFTKRLEDSILINRELVLLLQRYKLNLGEAKTSQATDMINGALKDDKLYWIEHDPVIKLTTDKFYMLPKKLMKETLEKYKEEPLKPKVFNKFFKKYFHNRTYQATLQKHLFIIKTFSDLYPNSGPLIGALHEFEERLSDMDYADFQNTGTGIEVLIAILVDIVKKNPKLTEVGVKLLSSLLMKIEFKEFETQYLGNDSQIKEDFEIRFAYINSVNNKLAQSNYNGYLEVWMQRIVIKNLTDKTELTATYIKNSKNELVQLCNSVLLKEKITPLFNEDWLKSEHRLDINEFIDLSEISKMPYLISSDEIYLAEYNSMS